VLYLAGIESAGGKAMKLAEAFIRPAALVSGFTALFILASIDTGEAAKKKAAAPADPATSVCFLVHHPVCATKGSARQTYNNSCYARIDGAKIVAQGACPAGKKKKS
jgi:hypothetical protein